MSGECAGGGAEVLTWDVGKGTQAPRLKDKYCACHLVRPHPLGQDGGHS